MLTIKDKDILKQKIRDILENKYLRTMKGLLEHRRRLSKSLLEAKEYPYTNGQKQLNRAQNKHLFEGLIKTYPTDKTINHIKNVLRKKELPIGEFIENNYYGESDIADSINVIVDCYSVTQELNDTLIKLFDSCGYYLSTFYWTEDKNNGVYQFEPKYREEEYKGIEIGDFLYHVTTIGHYNKIIKQGFIPKSKNKIFDYPPRCYFFTEKNVDFMKEFMIDSRKAKEGEELVLITVDTNKLSDDIKFWDDQLFVGEDIAVYTYNNIPTSAIINVERIC